jgi:hypothetical protein
MNTVTKSVTRETPDLEGLNLLHDTRIVDGEILLEMPNHEVRRRIDNGEMFGLKNVFDVSEIRGLVDGLLEAYRGETPEFLPYTWNQRNHWRIDDKPPNPAIPKSLALYFAFIWNDRFDRLREIAGMLARLRNRIAGLPVNFGFNRDDEYWVVPTVQHAPCGGGFLSRHNDPPHPDGCVVSLFMSQRGEHYREGGMFIERDGQPIDMEGYFGTGDMFMFRPDIVHGIAPIDPADKRDFSATDGRWRMAAVLTQAIQP